MIYGHVFGNVTSHQKAATLNGNTRSDDFIKRLIFWHFSLNFSHGAVSCMWFLVRHSWSKNWPYISYEWLDIQFSHTLSLSLSSTQLNSIWFIFPKRLCWQSDCMGKLYSGKSVFAFDLKYANETLRWESSTKHTKPSLLA